MFECSVFEKPPDRGGFFANLMQDSEIREPFR